MPKQALPERRIWQEGMSTFTHSPECGVREGPGKGSCPGHEALIHSPFIHLQCISSWTQTLKMLEFYAEWRRSGKQSKGLPSRKKAGKANYSCQQTLCHHRGVLGTLCPPCREGHLRKLPSRII